MRLKRNRNVKRKLNLSVALSTTLSTTSHSESEYISLSLFLKKLNIVTALNKQINRQGNGAPLYDENGNIVTMIKGYHTHSTDDT
jgi:hypothetical protein